MSTTKKCNRCKKELDLISFNKWKNGKYLTTCILCNKRRVLTKNKTGKICNRCFETKDYDQFTKIKTEYSLNCTDCFLKIKEEKKQKTKEKYDIKKQELNKKIIDDSNIKICSRCEKEKNIICFRKRKSGEYYKQCIDCNHNSSKIKLKNRKIKENNIEAIDDNNKKCFNCFEVKILSDFKKNKKGYTKYCIKCLSKNLELKYKRIKYDGVKENKKCSICFVVKSLESFKKNKENIQKQCEECCLHLKKIQKARKQKLLIEQTNLKIGEKQCTRCFEIKNETNFKSNIHKHCISCNNKHFEYLNKNRCEHGCLNKSACYKCLGGSICIHKIKKCECKVCNFAGFLYRKVASRVRSTLKKGTKSKRTIEYLGCHIEIFRKHLEDKFVEGMSWENYGKIWHIDHIIPINYKNPTLNEVIERLHYLNTQPLWASQNISKGNRYIG